MMQVGVRKNGASLVLPGKKKQFYLFWDVVFTVHSRKTVVWDVFGPSFHLDSFWVFLDGLSPFLF